MDHVVQKMTTAEQLSEVIAYLKKAESCIRQGDIYKALEEIKHAREKNPTIMYARAYEEYVHSLQLKIQSLTTDKTDQDQSLESIIAETLPTLDKILALAIKEVNRRVMAVYKQKEMIALQKQREEEIQREETLRAEGIKKKITIYLNRAREFQNGKDYHNALNEVARAFILNPTDERILELEEQIKQQQEQANKEEELENSRRQQELQRRRQQLIEEWQLQRQREKEKKQKQEAEAYQQARTMKIREYLHVARTLFAQQKFEEALSQIAFVLVLDPLNEEVLSLNWQIRQKQAERSKEQLEKKQQLLEEENKKKKALQEGVRRCLARAEQYFAEKKYFEALQMITQAYFIDPISEEVAAVESKILAAEEEEINRLNEERMQNEEKRIRKIESELHRLAIELQKREQLNQKIDFEKKQLKEQEEVLLYLSKARGYASQGKYDDALEYVALAFKTNPFDEEITKLQHEIVEAKQKSRQPLTEGEQLFITQSSSTEAEEKKQAIVQRFIQSAQELRQQLKYKKALDEIAQAYQYDPLNEELFRLEGEIQQELLKYEEQLLNERETNLRNNAIKKSLATARDFASRELYAEALAWVDYALSFDMQRYETLQVKEEIEKAQRLSDERKANEDKEVVIQAHLSRAMQYLAEKRFAEATLEIDLALRLNPSHKEALSLHMKLKNQKKEPLV